MRTSCSLVLPSLLLLAGTASAAPAEKAPSYAKDIKPFLTKYCASCHNNTKAKSGYNVETFASLTKAGKKGTLVVPADLDASLLLATLNGDAKQMPPRNKPQPTDNEIAKVRDWIKTGAKDDSAGAADARNPVANADKKKADNPPAARKRGDRRKMKRGDDDDRKRRDRRKRDDDDDDRKGGDRRKRERD